MSNPSPLRRPALLLIGTLFTGAALSLPSSAATLGFLKNAPVGSFKQEDLDLVSGAAKEVLESDDDGARREWSNPRTGNSGLVEVRSAFTGSDGAPCKRLHFVNRAKGEREGQATYAVCKYPERGWLLHPDAAPARKEGTDAGS